MGMERPFFLVPSLLTLPLTIGQRIWKDIMRSIVPPGPPLLHFDPPSPERTALAGGISEEDLYCKARWKEALDICAEKIDEEDLEDLTLKSQQTLQKIIEMLTELGHNLKLFHIYQTMFSEDSGMGVAFVDVLVEVVTFGVSTIQFLCNNPIENMARDVWGNVERHFTDVTTSITRRIRHVKENAEALRQKTLVQQQQDFSPANLANMINNLNIGKDADRKIVHKDENATLPCRVMKFRGISRFIDRPQLMKDIHNILKMDRESPRLRSLTLWGVAGVGKSQTAFRYAKDQAAEELDAVFWINSETELQLAEAFTEIAVALKLKGADATAAATWLIVFDNVDKAEVLCDYWPEASSGAILITSKSVTTAAELNTDDLELRSLTGNDGRDMVLALPGKLDSNVEEVIAGEELSNLVGGLPLAIDLMATHIRKRRVPIQQFIPLYKSDHRQMHKGLVRGGASIYYPRSIDTAWQLSFQTLLEYEISQELVDAGLVAKDPDALTFSVHRLIQGEFRDREESTPKKKMAWFQAATELLFNSFPKQEKGLPLRKYWNDCKRLIQHVVALSGQYDALTTTHEPLEENVNFSKLLASAAWYLLETNAYDQCLDIIAVAFRSCPEATSVIYATLCNTAGQIFAERAQMEKAYDNLHKALVIREKELEPNDGELADSYNNFALLLLSMGQVEEGSTYLKKAIAADRTRPQEEQAETAHLRALNLSSLHEARRGYENAIEEAAAGREHSIVNLGKGNHFQAQGWRQEGNCLFYSKQYAKAYEYLENALNLFEGDSKTQPIVATNCYTMARVKLSQGHGQEAVELLRKALLVCKYNERIKGDQGDSTRIMRKLAEALGMLGETEEAMQFEKAAKAIRKELQGDSYREDLDDDASWNALVHVIFR
ncbi:hypothetical protein BDV96DRAFT_654203 [Lophiotrema nucula]|uniref:DUF7708 domain-containing protein n=1 Tax=Lophiotrema nucula TaxID=690887 RepID=A0A6A5YHZ4_9PLEO|nr:hypothetical protein BDV96DRAFT_654203 [Lophiotrema nucula]